MEMWKYAVQLKQPVSNPDLSFVHVPNGHAFLMGVDVDINSQGLRDYEYSFAKPPETYRIMMLGDSTTLGWGVPVTPFDDHPNGKANALIAQQLREWFRTQPRFWLLAQQTR